MIDTFWTDNSADEKLGFALHKAVKGSFYSTLNLFIDHFLNSFS